MVGFNIKPLEIIADKVLSLESDIEKLTDTELRSKTEEFKDRFKNGEGLDDLLVEAFAVMREASWRVFGKKHYKVQVIGGIVLHQGRVAEMKTGEGKTLTELLPAYLNGLSGNGVHIATVNDYLARRDMLEMRDVFQFLGMTVGITFGDMNNPLKRIMYNQDITYSTNSKLGFDYLFDNLEYFMENNSHRKFNYCILDEIDSILIDDSNSPLIISGKSSTIDPLVSMCDKWVRMLDSEEDLEINVKEQAVVPSEKGMDKIQELYREDAFIGNIKDVVNFTGILSAALKAHYIFKKGKDYKVQNGKIVLIDQGTGRVADGRRFSDGLHTALEAKERVEILPDQYTQGQITYQHFFQMYDKLSGMSGTVKTNEEEFKEIYNLDIVEIPTNKPIARQDKEDRMFLTDKDRLSFVVNEIKDIHSTGRPILVGTPNDKKSVELSNLLKKEGIPHNLLNTDNLENEANIIAKAGTIGSITVATNIAGRGTDIKISGAVNNLGGLAVISTERALNRRIDNQLIGRSGRQGNNGSSQFFLSLEDEIFKMKYGDDYEDFLEKYSSIKGLDDAERCNEITSSKIQKLTHKSQDIVESLYYSSRKDIVKYQEVINKQRGIIFADRDAIISKDFDFCQYLKDKSFFAVKEIISSSLEKQEYSIDDITDIDERAHYFQDLYINFLKNFSLGGIFAPTEETASTICDCWSEEELFEHFYGYLERFIDYNNENYHDEFITYLRMVSVREIDDNWMYALSRLDKLRIECAYAPMKQVDPVLEYKDRANGLMDLMIRGIQLDTVKAMLEFEHTEVVIDEQGNV